MGKKRKFGLKGFFFEKISLRGVSKSRKTYTFVIREFYYEKQE